MRKTSKTGWIELCMGIVILLLGIYSLFNPRSLLGWVVRIYGLLAIITGIADIIFYVKTTRYTGFAPMISLITGIISTMAGFMLFIYPGSGSLILVMLLPIWIIAHCISRLCHINEVRYMAGNFRYYFSLVINILGIVVGVIMIFSPAINFLAAGVIIGVSLIIIGVEFIANGIDDVKKKY